MKEQLLLAGRLRKQRELDKAISIYQELWEDSEEFNQWDSWSYGHCLLKTNQVELALAVCREAYPKYKEFGMLKSLYAQVIYQIHFKDKQAKHRIEILEKAAKAIQQLTPFHEAYSMAAKAYFSLARAYLNQPTKSWQKVEDLLVEIDPNLLDDQAFAWKSKGKNISIASDMEQWYAMMIKAKAGLEKYEEVLALLKQTRQQGIRWHYNNDIWFSRLEAFAHYHLGDVEKAEAILRSLLIKKKEWFLIFDLAKVLTDSDAKLRYLCDAALAKGKMSMKLGLYQYLYSFLEKDYKEVSLKHLALVLAIRKQSKWRVSEEERILVQTQLPDFSAKSVIEITTDLQAFWRRYASKSQDGNKRLKGKIIHILPNEKSGFIKTKKQSYFASFHGLKEPVVKGENYSFVLKESFDKKKNKASMMALRLKKVKE